MKSKWFTFDKNSKDFYSKGRFPKKLSSTFDKSIEKWKLITKGYHACYAIDTCGLCNLFNANDCENCPVANDTGKSYCEDTPYAKWRKASKKVTALKYAKQELEYLKKLKIKYCKKTSNKKKSA